MLYKDIKLGQTCELIPGFAFKSDDFGPAGIKVIKIKDIQPPFININDSDCVNIQKYDIEKLKKYLVKEGDFLLAMTGATIGKVGMYIDKTPSYINQRVLLFKPHQGYVKNFIYYCVNSSSFRDFVFNNVDSASAQPNISANTIAEFPIKNFDITIQNKIAITLSVLDKKILLNTHINSELEAMAKQLYDYWFVQFDFPDENGKPYKSSGGKMVYNEILKREIPEGWEVKQLKELLILEDNRRIPLSNKERENRKGIYPYYGATGIMDYIDDYIFDGDYILLAEDGSTSDDNGNPVVQYIWGKNWVNNHAHIVHINDDSQLQYYYFLLKTIPVVLIETGSIQKKISQDNLLGYSVINPPSTIIEHYCNIASSCRENQKKITDEINYLTHLRDSLLPMLMNGQVTVE